MRNFLVVLLCYSVSLYAQLPSIVHNGVTALENIEAEALKSSESDPFELFRCQFDVPNPRFKGTNTHQLVFKTTGLDNLIVEIHKPNFERKATFNYDSLYKKTVTVDSYSPTLYNRFTKSLVSDFLRAKKGKFYYQISSSSEGLSWHNDLLGKKDTTIDFILTATAKKRSELSQCVSMVGCAFSEFTSINRQSWSYLDTVESGDDYIDEVMRVNFANQVNLAAAAEYDEVLTGAIRIDGESFLLKCQDKFLPHYTFSAKMLEDFTR